MNFYFSFKVIKEKEQKKQIPKKTTNIAPANIRNQTNETNSYI